MPGCRPVDILGVDHDRLATSAIFAVSVGWILKLVIGLNDQSHESKWVAGTVEYKTVYKENEGGDGDAQIKHKLRFDTILKLDLQCFYPIHVFSWFYNSISAFVAVGYVLEIAMLFYPFFGCLTTEHRLIGSTMGLLYTFMW